MSQQPVHIALVGNPNCGKSTLFNQLTGLSQKTSNLPGTTVEKKTGEWKTQEATYILTDLPGTYSLDSTNSDEAVVREVLRGINGKQKPDRIVFVADASNLRRNLFLYSQVAELGIPMCIALNMMDTATRRGIVAEPTELSLATGVLVVPINARLGEGLNKLGDVVAKMTIPQKNIAIPHVSSDLANPLHGVSERYAMIDEWLKPVLKKSFTQRKSISLKLDRLFTHRIWGFVVFTFIMWTIFQGIFTLAEYPMEWIEVGFGAASAWLLQILPSSVITDLLANGLIPGLAGVLVFLPQIAILFTFIALLEDSGYMTRASFITDRMMRKVGLNGRSVIPMVGGFACAIPSIMATRTITNKTERLITMFIIPLMSCSARLPIYILLISLAVPDQLKWGPFGAQGVIMTGIYMAGIIAAAGVAAIMHFFLRKQSDSSFMLELPAYQIPRLKNVFYTAYTKSKSFVLEAGKIIILISMVLWFLASYGPQSSMDLARAKASAETKEKNLNEDEAKRLLGAYQLEASYAGHMGKWIEPAIAPLGFDWKTGIAIISSFAAREVFVGTMSTLFSAGSDEGHLSLKTQMMREKSANGKPKYGMAYAISLLVFFAFALQCMSTIAVMKRETKGWKWPIIQMIAFLIMAWGGSFITFQILS